MPNISSNGRKPNRLIHEKSPYLLQHAYNPIDWYPWGNEAFEKAREEDKPVFVSIGYSSCHWCHVMEKESFEDDAVAQLMNDAFVCVKVDREERPDLDAVYMAICQAMGRNCGWPLNVIMTPSKAPFFVASYIPKDNRYGTIGMLMLVPQIEQIWKNKRTELEAMGKELYDKISNQSQTQSAKEPGLIELDDAFDQLFLAFDHENGGFGYAPKFPSPHNLLFLMRYYNRTKQQAAWDMVDKTLRAMRTGGIFDQIGFGFHRYSTDARWLVPHFEKMLYDQALLTLAYIEAYQASGELKFMISAKETLDYVVRDLTSVDGGFFASEDADSEGEEGGFYVWTLDEIFKALPSELADFATKLFEIKSEGNFFEPQKGKNCKNILHLAIPLEQMAAAFNMTINEVIAKLGQTVNILFKVREKRVHPLKDDKILVDWNGLTIASLARANQILGEQRFLKAAERSANFVLSQMRTDDNRLYHRYAKGEKAVLGFLDDYAFFVFGLIELYEACFDEKYLQASISLTKKMIEEFWDDKRGGFYLTSKNADSTIPRIKQTYDSAIPSGNSVALFNLLRLARLTSEISFEEYAEKLLKSFSYDIKGYPMGHTFMLSALNFALGPSVNVVLAGDLAGEDTQALLAALKKTYLPNMTIRFWRPDKANLFTESVVSYPKINGEATVYVCIDQTCMPPTNKIEEMLEYLKKASASHRN